MKFCYQINILLVVFIFIYNPLFAEIISANFKIGGVANYEFQYDKTDDISIDNNGKLSLSNWGYATKYKINCSMDIKQRKFHKFVFYYYHNINTYGGYPQGETRDSLYIENLPFELDENENLIVDISNADIDSTYYPMYFVHYYYYLKDVKAKIDKQYYKLEELKTHEFNLTFKLYHNKTLDIGETNFYEFDIYPNPAFDFIVVNSIPIDGNVIELYNFMGTLIQKDTSQLINIEHLKPGGYFLKFGDRIKKFVKY